VNVQIVHDVIQISVQDYSCVYRGIPVYHGRGIIIRKEDQVLWCRWSCPPPICIISSFLVLSVQGLWRQLFIYLKPPPQSDTILYVYIYVFPLAGGGEGGCWTAKNDAEPHSWVNFKGWQWMHWLLWSFPYMRQVEALTVMARGVEKFSFIFFFSSLLHTVLLHSFLPQ
jgi:hypothetical protein